MQFGSYAAAAADAHADATQPTAPPVASAEPWPPLAGLGPCAQQPPQRLLAYIFLTVSVALERRQDAGTSAAAAMIAITVPELLRLLRGAVIPPPRRDRDHVLHWSGWRRRHQHRAQRAHRRWNTYADTVA